MSEYIDKTLHEILEELALYCHLNGAPKAKIFVKLPKIILDKYSLTFSARERLFLDAKPVEGVLKQICFQAGTVELESYE